jgi:hypothetical protein
MPLNLKRGIKPKDKQNVRAATMFLFHIKQSPYRPGQALKVPGC